MEFFCYHRDRSGSLPLRVALGEAHWAYMDAYGAELIAAWPDLRRGRRDVSRWPCGTT